MFHLVRRFRLVIWNPWPLKSFWKLCLIRVLQYCVINFRLWIIEVRTINIHLSQLLILLKTVLSETLLISWIILDEINFRVICACFKIFCLFWKICVTMKHWVTCFVLIKIIVLFIMFGLLLWIRVETLTHFLKLLGYYCYKIIVLSFCFLFFEIFYFFEICVIVVSNWLLFLFLVFLLFSIDIILF